MSNLLRSLEILKARTIETVLFTSQAKNSALVKDFPADHVVHTGLFKPKSLGRMSARISRNLIGHCIPDEWLFRRSGATVGALMPPMGRRSRFRTASWIPDFQHVHFPRFFKPKELEQRDRMFSAIARDAALVIVSSRTALADLERFCPGASDKARVLRFVANPASKSTAGLIDINKAYGITEPFFFLPNQFWTHKNHRVVIDALAILQARGWAPLVVCTGDTRDYRRPDHFNTLIRHATASGVAGRFLVLGVVPYEHVLALMDYSLAVLNPSLFEGWSTSLEEAKSRGKRVIYSAIPTHNEQDPPRGLSFPPEDPAALAEQMLEVASSHDKAVEHAAKADAELALPERLKNFGLVFQAIAIEAADLSSSNIK